MRRRLAELTEAPIHSFPLRHYPLLHFRCWPARCFLGIMNNVGHLPLSETAARRSGSTKARRGRPRKNNAHANVVREPAAVGTLPRTKSLLLAALRVWELKQ